MVNATIHANGIAIRLASTDAADYISLTDIAKYHNPDAPADVVKKLVTYQKYN